MSDSIGKSRKLISIIIATYNCGNKIEGTLHSIFSQDRDLFELIIVDGESTDKTLENIKKYEDELILISEKDMGIYDAFNKGINTANGEYIYFIGAGDHLKPGVLRHIKDHLPFGKPTFVYGKCYFVKQKYINGKKFTAKLFIRDNLCQQGIFYHRSIFEILGKFDLQYIAFADWFFNIKCFLHNGIKKHYLDYVIADFEEGGLSSEIKRDRVFMQKFPVFVKDQFGFSKYIICKLFLNFPYAFNYIYYSNYKMLLRHWIYNYKIPGYLASLIKPTYKFFKRKRSESSSR